MPEDNEPDPKAPEVNVDGKQTDLDIVKIKKDEYEELTKNNKELTEFVAALHPYMKKTDNGLEWDIAKVVDDSGFDSTSLVKKGEKKPDDKTLDKGEPVSDTEKMKSDFNKDPVGYLKKFGSEIAESVKASLIPELAEVKKDVVARRTRDMLAEVREAHPDIDDYQVELAALIRKKPPKDATDLEDLYFAAKGHKEAGSTPGLGLSTSGAKAKAKKKEPQLTAEQQILAEIVGASGDNTPKQKAARNIFGTNVVAPLKLGAASDQEA